MATSFVAHFYPEQDFSKAVCKGRKLEVIGTTFRTRGGAVKALFQKLQQSPRDVRHLTPYIIELDMPSRKVVGYEIVEFKHAGYGGRRRNGEVSPGTYALDIPGGGGRISGREIITPNYYARVFDVPGTGFFPSAGGPSFREVPEQGPVVRDYPQAPVERAYVPVSPPRSLPAPSAEPRPRKPKAEGPSRAAQKAERKAAYAAARAEQAAASEVTRAEKKAKKGKKASTKPASVKPASTKPVASKAPSAKLVSAKAAVKAAAKRASMKPSPEGDRYGSLIPPRSSRAQTSQLRMEMVERVLQTYWDRLRATYEASGKTGRIQGLPGDQMPIPTWFYPEEVLREMTSYGLFALATALGVPYRRHDIPKYGDDPNNKAQTAEGTAARGLIPEIMAIQRKAGIEKLAREGALATATLDSAKTEISIFDAIGRKKNKRGQRAKGEGAAPAKPASTKKAPVKAARKGTTPKAAAPAKVAPKGTTPKAAAAVPAKAGKKPKKEVSPEEQANREQDKLERPPQGEGLPLRAKVNSRGDRILVNHARAGEILVRFDIMQANADYNKGGSPSPAFVRALNEVDAGKRSVEDIKAMLKAKQHVTPGTRPPTTPPKVVSPKKRASTGKPGRRSVFPVAFGTDALGAEDRTQIVARGISGREMPEELAILTSKLERLVARTPGYVVQREVIDIFNDPDTSYEDLNALLVVKKGDTSHLLEPVRTGRTTPKVSSPRGSARGTTKAVGALPGSLRTSTRKSGRSGQQPLPFEDAGKAADEFWEGNVSNLLDI